MCVIVKIRAFFINKGTQFELCGFLHFLIADKRREKEETSCRKAASGL